MDLKDKGYFSVAGETESSAPKSINSFARFSFEVWELRYYLELRLY